MKLQGGVKKRTRQLSALKRLKEQLNLGFKNDKSGKPVLLTDNDLTRIKREINILEEKLN